MTWHVVSGFIRSLQISITAPLNKSIRMSATTAKSTSTKSTSTAPDAHKRAPQQATEADKAKISQLIKDVGGYCMLVTIDRDGCIHSRPMGVNGELELNSDGSVALWFFTYSSSMKCSEMDEHGHQCNLAFMDPQQQKFVSLSGKGELVKDRAIMEKRWHVSYKAWFPKGLDEPDCALLKICITKAEYWDAPASIIAHAISFVKSQVTGVPADPAEHAAVKMKTIEKAEKKEQTREEAKMQDV